jgi:hypothetical protein
MKMSFSVKNSRFLKTLFKGKANFVDVFVNEDTVALFVDSIDVFAYVVYGVVSEEPIDSLGFRIPKDGFLSVIEDGIFYISVFDGVVYVKIDNGNFSHTISFGQQVCPVVSVVDKIELFSRSTMYPKVRLSDLALISKLSRGSRFPISIEDGIAFVELEGVMIFSRTKCSDMAVFPAELSSLLYVCGDSNEVYNVENYIVFVGDGFGYAITKATSLGNNNYSFVKRDREVDSVSVDFSVASSLLSRIRKFECVVFDINSSEFTLQCEDGMQFSAPIKILSGEELAGAKRKKKDAGPNVIDDLLGSVSDGSYVRQYPNVVLPEVVFRQMLYLSKSKSVRFSFSRTMIRVKISDNTLLVCRR